MALNKTVTNAITDSAINTDKIADGTLIADDFAGSTINVSKTSLGVSEPTISSFTPSELTITSGGAITINGAGFISIPQVRFINQSTGAVVEASAVSFTSTSQISATMPASQTEGTYKFVVENSNGLSVQSSTAITYSNGPTWTTSAGTLGTFTEGESVSVTVAATDGSETVDTFAIVSGSLPSGLSLNTSTGVISGTAAAVGANTTSNFTIRATDDEGQTADRAFAITIADFAIPNSLRFNDGSSDYLNRTNTGAGNRRTFTYSFWVKRSTIGTDQRIIEASTDSSGNYVDGLEFTSDNIRIVSYHNSDDIQLVTDREFRDVAAWYHIVVAFDTTQSAESDRVKLYVNGVQETSFSTSNYPSLNYDTYFNNNSDEVYIGRRIDNGGSPSGEYFDGYLAEVVLVDGQALTPTSFGETNSDGVWVPIQPPASVGTNGFHLDFEDSSSLGNDAAGSNNFTVNNLASTDQTEDTPLNNYATFNTLIKSSSEFTNGNLKYNSPSSNPVFGSLTTIGVESGKWYAEVKYEAGSNHYLILGIADEVFATLSDLGSATNTDLGKTGSLGHSDAQNSTIAYVVNTGAYRNNNSNTSWGSGAGDGDTIMIALDRTNRKVYFGVNGTWGNSSDPANGTGGIDISSLVTGDTYFIGVTNDTGSSETIASFNFGNPNHAITSSQSDANGYGNFEYTVPTGYFALNTKNLAQYG